MVKVATNEANLGGGFIDQSCGCHFAVEDVEVQLDQGNVIVKSTVLRSHPPGQEGKTQTEYFKLTGKAVSRLIRFAVAIGLMTEEQFEADKAAGRDSDIPVEDGVGRQFKARISLDEYKGNKEENKGKKFPAMNFDIFSPFDKRAADIPMDPEWAKLITAPAAKSNAQSANGNGQATTPPQPAATGGGFDVF